MLTISSSNTQGRRKPPSNMDTSVNQGSSAVQGDTSSLKEGWRRKANFGGSLTKPDEKQSWGPPGNQSEKRKGKSKQWLPKGDDLASSLIRDLSSPPYP